MSEEMEQSQKDKIYELYEESRAAYTYYLKVKGGDLLSGNQAPDPEEVAEARDNWIRKLETLYDSGGAFKVVRALIQERAAANAHRVKRAKD